MSRQVIREYSKGLMSNDFAREPYIGYLPTDFYAQRMHILLVANAT